MANAISTDFPASVTAEVISETVEDAPVTPGQAATSGAAAVTATWAAGAASVAACLALW